MDRNAAIGFLLLLAGAAGAKKPTPSSRPAKKAAALSVKSIDLAHRAVVVELAGVSKPPSPNLFRFTDERERHFVAMNVACEPPSASGVRVCALEIPGGYQRHRLVAVELHLGGLHSRTIAASQREVAEAWTGATRVVVVEPSPSPEPSPLPRKR